MPTRHAAERLRSLLIAAIVVTAPFSGTQSVPAQPCPTTRPLPFALGPVTVVTSIPRQTRLRQLGSASTTHTWVQMIDGARSSIKLLHFYFTHKPGSASAPVIAALQRAAARGVAIRILAERRMRRASSRTLGLISKLRGLQLRSFDWRQITGGINHAKVMIIDDREVFVGSQNFDWRALSEIHETGLRIQIPAVARAASYLFELDWVSRSIGDYTRCLAVAPHFRFSPQLYLLGSPPGLLPPGVKPAIGELIRLIDRARQRITVQLLSYNIKAPYDKQPLYEIDRALRRAAKRGVRVRMLIADWSKRKPSMATLKSLALQPNIEIRFVTIPVARDGFVPYSRVIHSKVMRIDKRLSWVGTSNWSYSYFHSSRNLEIVSRLPHVARLLDRQFKQIWRSRYAHRLDPLRHYKPPRIH